MMRKAFLCIFLYLVASITLFRIVGSDSDSSATEKSAVLEDYTQVAKKGLESQRTATLLNFTNPLEIDDLQKLFKAVKEGKGEVESHEEEEEEEESKSASGSSEKYVLKPEALLKQYNGSRSAAETINLIAPSILACKVDKECTFETEEEEEETSGSKTSLVWVKVVIAVVFVIEHLVAAFVPYFAARFAKANFYLSIISCFSAGVLLAAGVLELIPEVIEKQEEISGLYNEYPLGLTLVLIGYFAVLFIDRIAFDTSSTKAQIQQESEAAKANVVQDPENAQKGNQPEALGGVAVILPRRVDEVIHAANKEKLAVPRTQILRRPLILLGAFSFHAVLEFIVMGLQTDLRTLLLLFAAIFLTEGPELMALSAIFIKAGATFKELCIYLIPLSVIPSAFLLIGLAISSVHPAVTMFFMAMATGTFIYVACNEILGEELEHVTGERSGLGAVAERYIYFFAAIGGILVLVVAMLIPHVDYD